MRFRTAWLPIALLLTIGVTAYLGCKPSETAQNPAGSGEQAGQQQEAQGQHVQQVGYVNAATPDATVLAFLTAVQKGDDQTASALLTTTARTEMQTAEMYVQPPGSPNAQFSIGGTKLMPEHNGAHVDSTWTDIVENGEQRTYEITWILRQEQQGWRVAGMSTELFPNQPRLVLNFENPADMQAQVLQANERMARESGQGEIRQATHPDGQPLR